MFLMDYPYIRRENFPYYDKQVTCNLVHAYIYVHSQRLIGDYLGYVV